MSARCYMNTLEGRNQIRDGNTWWDPAVKNHRMKDGRLIIMDDFLPKEGIFDEGSPEGEIAEARMVRMEARERSYREFKENVA